MSVETVKTYLKSFGRDEDVQEFPVSSATVELAAAALSVRGLATALVFLRGALIRTGIGALIVGAGDMA